MGRSYRAGLHAELEGSVTDPFTEKEDFGGCGSDKSDRILSDDFPHTVIPDYHDGGGVIAQSNSVGLLKSVRRSSDVPTRIADPCPTCLTPQTTNRLSQVSRRGTFSEDVRMQSTPRKQLQFYNSCSDSKRDAHRLPASPAFRQIQRCSGQCTHGEVEERDVHWDSIQHENQYHVQNDETLIQDLKSLTEATGPGVGLPEATGVGMVLLSGSTGREDGLPEETGPDAGVPEAMDLSALPEEVIYNIARRLAPSRRDVEALGAVCRNCRRAVLRTRGPWLILSPVNDGRPTVFLRIEQGVLVRQAEPMHPPPRTATCWSCCCGLMALRVQDARGFLLCVNCGFRQLMPQMPENVGLVSVTATTHLVCAFSVEDPVIRWARHGEQGWHQFAYELAIEPKSMCWRDGVACLAAAPPTLIIDEPPMEDPNPAPAPIMIDFVVDIPPGMAPWNIRGHHVLHIGADTFVCILLRHDEDQHHVEVRLFMLHVDADGNGTMLAANTIGNNAIFLGSNQSFATTAGLSITPNTAYVVDDDGAFHGARVLAIDLLTGDQHILLYPAEIGPADSFMPASWLGPLPDAELEGHCMD